MAEEDNLDALCDLLEDSDDEKDETIGSQLDDSFDEQIFNLVDEEVAKIEAVKPDDKYSPKNIDKKPKDEKPPAEGENKTQVNEMEEKLRKKGGGNQSQSNRRKVYSVMGRILWAAHKTK